LNELTGGHSHPREIRTGRFVHWEVMRAQSGGATVSGTAIQPVAQRNRMEERMSKQAADHHHAAAEHHEHAAHHHKHAAKHHEDGKHEAAAHHAHLAHGHNEHASHHATEAAKAHVEHHKASGAHA
jgi:hypothetical protein